MAEYGYCQCGCGNKTRIATQNYKAQNLSKGEPARFLRGHHMWKGDNVGYWGIHHWINKTLGSPRVCWSCGTDEAKKYEWANISGEYKRDVNDFIRLCYTCHRIFDDNFPAGESHGLSKLKTSDVVGIRKLYSGGEHSSRKIARMFGVKQSCILNIVHRRTWRHIK